MKRITTILFLFLSSLFASHGQDLNNPKIVEMLKKFNMDSAKMEMKTKKIPLKDQKGYLDYLKRKYLHKYYNEELSKRNIKTYLPQNVSTSFCPNAGFEDLDFNSWIGETGYYNSPTSWSVGIVTAGLNGDIFDFTARHTIMTLPTGNNDPLLGGIEGYDPIALNPITGLAEIPVVPPFGNGVSCRLGNANVGSESERLTYIMDVTSDNSTFYYQFAIVLQDPNHPPDAQPYFKITVRDSNGVNIGGSCGTYYISSTLAKTDTTFIKTTYNGEDLYYRNWHLVGVDLKAQIGQKISVEFETSDCGYGAHFGYAYIDAGCGKLKAQQNYCTADTMALIVAPPGYGGYLWLGPNSRDTIANFNNDSLFITTPILNDTFIVQLFSEAGCMTELETVLQYGTVSAIGIYSTPSCPTGSSGTAIVIPSGSVSGYSYLWTPGGYTTASVTGLSPGTYSVHIESPNSNCGFIDTTVVIGIDTVNSALQLQKLICIGDTITFSSPFSGVHSFYDSANQLLYTGSNLSYQYLNPPSGVYVDTIISTSGCINVYKTDISYTQIDASIYKYDNYCYDGKNGYIYTNILSGPSGSSYVYSWTDTSGSILDNSSYLYGLAAGQYMLEINSGSCFYRDTITINQPAKPNDTLQIATNFCVNDISAVLYAPIGNGIGTYQWYYDGVAIVGANSDSIAISAPENYNHYTVSYGTLPYGCKRLSSAIFKTEQLGFELDQTTNVFTPNGDLMNDYFYPLYIKGTSEDQVDFYAEEYSIKIYNRWGKEVFKSEDYGSPWDGKYSGELVPEGVYYWEVLYRSYCDHELVKKYGFVHLLR